MIGIAMSLGGRAASALWVMVLAATASMRPLIDTLFEWLNAPVDAEGFIGEQSGFGGWLFQASWAPQHLASATAAVLALVLLVRLAERPNVSKVALLALTMAASVQSSIWVGGVVLSIALVITAMFLIERAAVGERWRLVLHFGGAALLAVLLISPFLFDQFAMAVARGTMSPITVAPYTVLSDGGGLARDIANLLAYWVIFLVVEFPGFLIAGLASLYWLRRNPSAADQKDTLLAITVIMLTGLIVAWLLRSNIADNNDLGWRAVLPAVIVLIAAGAAGLSSLTLRSVPVAVAAVLVALGVPDGLQLMRHNLVGVPDQSASDFAASGQLWDAVRRNTAPEERVANNPRSFAQMTPWPANMSWALMANRRSCYAGIAFVEAFTALSRSRQAAIDAQFMRIFAGEGDPDDVEQLATRYNCSTIVLTPADGAWSRDLFAGSPHYRVVESAPGWRIYKLVEVARLDSGVPVEAAVGPVGAGEGVCYFHRGDPLGVLEAKLRCGA
jgi:hypothetical protein